MSQIIVAVVKSDPKLEDIKHLLAGDYAQTKCIELAHSCAAGRALQMNTGAQLALADILLFIHADTRLPKKADELIIKTINKSWGRFDVQLDDDRFIFSIISWFINKRSRLTQVSTGDQAIFVNRGLFKKLGGFPDQQLMEDVEFCKRARRYSNPEFISAKVTTSARRWQQGGIIKTVLLMWWLRALYFFGVAPQRLADMYRNIR